MYNKRNGLSCILLSYILEHVLQVFQPGVIDFEQFTDPAKSAC